MKNLTLKELGQLSLTATSSKPKAIDIELEVDGEIWTAYEVYIAKQDLLFFTDKGTVTYLVDNYGGEAVITIHDWERD
jgi:hypothetical protein